MESQDAKERGDQVRLQRAEVRLTPVEDRPVPVEEDVACHQAGNGFVGTQALRRDQYPDA